MVVMDLKVPTNDTFVPTREREIKGKVVCGKGGQMKAAPAASAVGP